MDQIIRIGMDTSKTVFQLHGVNAAEEVVLRRKLRRNEMIRFFEKLPPAVIAVEACGGSHHWARFLGGLGHQVKLIAPQLALTECPRCWRDIDRQARADRQPQGRLRAMGDRTPQAQTSKARCCRPGQQTGSYSLEADGIRRELRPHFSKISGDSGLEISSAGVIR
jgi:transposase